MKMKERNIALIGYRATGKTTVGKILARKLEREFIDMDLRLTAESAQDIASWVAREGWNSFRTAESRLLQIIRLQKGLVVATGGGIILNPQNREALRKDFFTVWLRAGPQIIHARLSSDPGSPQMRPALSGLPIGEEIEKVLAEREPLYSQVADIQVDTEGKLSSKVAEEILRAVSSYTGV